MIPGIFRWATLLSLGATLTILWVWLGGLGERDGNLWLAAVLTLIAVPALPGLWQGRSYTYAWASMLALPYMGLALVEAYANPAARALAFATLLSSGLWFVSCLLYVRGNRRRVEHLPQ